MATKGCERGSLHRQQDVYLLLSIHLPPAFLYIHAHQAHFVSLESGKHDIGVSCAWSTLALSSSALPSGAAVLCRLELGWGELASGPVQFLCPVLTDHMRPSAVDPRLISMCSLS